MELCRGAAAHAWGCGPIAAGLPAPRPLLQAGVRVVVAFDAMGGGVGPNSGGQGAAGRELRRGQQPPALAGAAGSAQASP